MLAEMNLMRRIFLTMLFQKPSLDTFVVIKGYFLFLFFSFFLSLSLSHCILYVESAFVRVH